MVQVHRLADPGQRGIEAHRPSPASARVASSDLPAGGGNGYCAFRAAGSGYRVRLCDLAPALIDDARRRDTTAAAPLTDIAVADARDLPYADDSADGAIFFGPMYGLADPADRALALAELVRVLRPGGIVLVETITKLGGLRGATFTDPRVLAGLDLPAFLASGVMTGDGLPPFYRGHVCADPEQTSAELRSAGLEVVDVVASDGPCPNNQSRLADESDEVVAAWVEAALSLGREPKYWNAANHVIHVARRRR